MHGVILMIRAGQEVTVNLTDEKGVESTSYISRFHIVSKRNKSTSKSVTVFGS